MADDLDNLAKQTQKLLDDQKQQQKKIADGVSKLEAKAKEALKAAKVLEEVAK